MGVGELDTLKIGDVIKTSGIVPGLPLPQMELAVTEKRKHLVTLEGRWCGVNVKKFHFVKNKDGNLVLYRS